MSLPKILITTGLAAMTGCGPIPPGASELTDEQRDTVEYLIDVAARSTPLVIEMVRSMDGGWVDRNGAVDDPELMVAEIEESQDDLQFYWDNGRFFAGPTSAMLYGDTNAVGYHSPEDLTPKDRSDNFVVLNSDVQEAWDAPLLAHEIVHFKAFHDATIESDLLAISDLNYGNIEVPRIVRKHVDSPYMSSGLFFGPTTFIVSLDKAREEAIKEAEALREAGGGHDALLHLKELLTMEDKYGWCEAQAANIHSQTIFQDEFGVDEQILAENIADSGAFETEKETRMEVIAEFIKEGQESTKEQLQKTRVR